MINVRIKNTTSQVAIKTTAPNVRTFKATKSSSTGATGISIGTPIGLLLALTYAFATGGSGTTTSTSDYKPSVRIITN